VNPMLVSSNALKNIFIQKSSSYAFSTLIRRGRPLSLKPRKLNELRNLWLNHKLVSHVLRKSEVSSLM